MSYDTGAFSQIVAPLQGLWMNAATLVPLLISALVVFVIGLIIATGLGALVEKILDRIGLNRLLKQLGVERYFERAGIGMNATRFLGQLVFWFVAIAFLLAASDILGLAALSSFLRQVVFYIPNVVVAILILLATVVIANVARSTVHASVKGARMPAAQFLGSLSWWAIVIFGLLATFSQLGIATSIIQSLVTGLIAMLALAGGLAFGLGGRDYAASLIDKLREHTES